MASRKGVCLVIGAGDGLGSAVARAFAAEGLTVCLTRRPRNLDRLEALAEEIRATGAAAHAFGCDAREEAEVIALFDRIEADIGPLEVVVFNVGANVRFPVVETTARVFTKVWEMACFAGFLAGREAARIKGPPAIPTDQAASAALAWPTMVANAALSLTASSASTLRSRPIEARFKPLISRL